MAVQLQRHTFTVDEYHKMLEAGVFTEDDRVELICGEVIEMPPIGSKHVGHVNRIARILGNRLGQRAIVSVQNPIRLDDRSEPQPDVAVLHFRDDDYVSAIPTGQDIYFLVEVSDTTIAYDRETKLPLYARAGVPEVWLLDLSARRVEVHRSPSPNGYLDMRHAYSGASLTPAAFPDLVVNIDEVLV
ncbi:MAG: Uma2 family endonuclease [Chloroflexi bacterium]|nr:Uma2 family endonuclease [Chloroflexota bacterium]